MNTDALVARIHEFGETSAVVSLLTAEYGCVRVLAKGAKRLKNSFLGPLDKGVLYRVRLGRRSGDGLVPLHSARAREIFSRLRNDPARFAAANVILEVASLLLRDNEPQPELFRLSVFSLKVINHAPEPRLDTGVVLFLARAVGLSGHGPVLDACTACGELVEDGDDAHLSPARGGLLHRACGRGEPASRPLSADGLSLLRYVSSVPAAEVLASSAPPRAAREVQGLLAGWLEYVLECRIRSLRPLRYGEVPHSRPTG